MSLTARVTVGQIGVCRESAAKRNPEMTHFNQGKEIKERAKKKTVVAHQKVGKPSASDRNYNSYSMWHDVVI